MRVTQDCLDEVRKTKDRSVRAVLLREAEGLVDYPPHWAEIAELWWRIGPAHHGDARRCLERGLEGAGLEVFRHREIADLYRRRLEDDARARAVMALAFDRFAAAGDAVRVTDWVYLAGGFADMFGDTEAVSRCLARGRARMTVPAVDDLCALAEGYANHAGDPGVARHLIEEAARVAEAPATHPHESGGWWTLANRYRHTLEDVEGSWRVLERGLAWSDSVPRCLRTARAVHSNAAGDEAHRPLLDACFTKAESLAVTAEEWLEIADTSRDLRGGFAATRRLLAAALAADHDGAVRARIAQAHRHWLDDAATADALAPRGDAPAAMVVVHERLDGWTAEPARLLDHLRTRISPASLLDIAQADRGYMAEKHLAALTDIHATGLIARPLDWFPRETVELYRWREGERIDYLARAFACTILGLDFCRAGYREALEPTLPVLVESCIILGDDALPGAIGLLVSLCESLENWRFEYAFALLALLLAAAAHDPADSRLPRLCERITATVDARGPHSPWLFALSSFDVRHGLWRALIHQLLTGSPIPQLAALAVRLDEAP